VGKLEKDARNASVYGDATVMLPMLIAAARERGGVAPERPERGIRSAAFADT